MEDYKTLTEALDAACSREGKCEKRRVQSCKALSDYYSKFFTNISPDGSIGGLPYRFREVEGGERRLYFKGTSHGIKYLLKHENEIPVELTYVFKALKKDSKFLELTETKDEALKDRLDARKVRDEYRDKLTEYFEDRFRSLKGIVKPSRYKWYMHCSLNNYSFFIYNGKIQQVTFYPGNNTNQVPIYQGSIKQMSEYLKKSNPPEYLSFSEILRLITE